MCEKLELNKKGFTLIEIMVVIAIIGILASIAIPNFLSYRAKSFCTAAEQDANNIAAAISDYFAIPYHKNMINENDIKFVVTPPNTARINGTLGAIVISVTDGTGQCPPDYMVKAPNWDAVTSIFTKTMP